MTRDELQWLLNDAVRLLRQHAINANIGTDLFRYMQAHALREEAATLRAKLQIVEQEMKWSGLDDLADDSSAIPQE